MPINFLNQLANVLQPRPTVSNNPSRISDQVLLALPFIGLWVGVDEFVPTKLVYELYDSSLASSRFVHGDGTFVIPENICFLEPRRGGIPELGLRRVIELIHRSVMYYQFRHSAGPYEMAVYQGQFITTNAVKSTLTYYSDLHTRPRERCPALTPHPPAKGYYPVPDKYFHDQSFPCVSRMSEPKWNFDPRIEIQPRVKGDVGDELRKKWTEFRDTYKYWGFSWDEFQRAVYCLVGLDKAGFVCFQDQKGDSKQQNAAMPLATSSGWTVDCFLTRFRKYVTFIERLSFLQCPNPIYWLEAELDDEDRLLQRGYYCLLMRPWKGRVDGKEVEPVVTWETLKDLEWQQINACYPQPSVQMVSAMPLFGELY